MKAEFHFFSLVGYSTLQIFCKRSEKLHTLEIVYNENHREGYEINEEF